jgi:hypothetical protein
MPTFMMSLNWTDQGIRSIKDSPKRSQAARDGFEVGLGFGGGHVVPPFASVAYILGQTACRCLSYFPIKCARRKQKCGRSRTATDSRSLNFRARQKCLRLQLSPATHVCRAFQIHLSTPVRSY